jgi:hypothetical protein
MKKSSYLFAVLLVAGMFIARPAHAQSNIDIAALIRSLIAQVQELQRQLVLIQQQEASDARNDDTDNGPSGDMSGAPTIKVIQSKAAEPGEIYSTERAYIYGAGLNGKLEVLFDCCKPRASATGWGSSDGYAEFTVPKWYKNGERVAVTVVNEARLSSEPYYVTIMVPNGDERKGYLKIDSPDGGEKLKAGKAFPISWIWKSTVDDEPMELRVTSDSCSVKDGLIASGIKNNGGYEWEVPEELVSEKCDYKIHIMVADIKSPHWDFDESDRSFQIVR